MENTVRITVGRRQNALGKKNMKVTLYKGFMSPIQGRNPKISESNKMENLLRKEGWKIDGSNFAIIEATTGKDLIHIMEVLRQIGVKENLVISGWA